MKLNFSNKKVIVILVLILLLAAGGVFWWEHYKQVRVEKIIEEIADYIVEETPEGKVIKSKDGNLSFKVPDGWKLKKEGKYIIVPVWIMSPELFENYKSYREDSEANFFNSKEGCLIEVGFDKEGVSSLKDLEERIKEAHQSFGLETWGSFETVEIDHNQALKNMLVSSLLGHYMGVFIPFNGKVYGFGVYSGEEYKERCAQEFNKFLETISINK